MAESSYYHSSHNISNLFYHFVCPTKYRRVVITKEVDKTLVQICEGIEARYEGYHFLEIGADKDHVHFLIQSIPTLSPTKIITTIKSITESRIFAEYPEVKKQLWGGSFWSSGYFVSTVGKSTNEDVIAEYVKNQGKSDCGEYVQLSLFKKK